MNAPPPPLPREKAFRRWILLTVIFLVIMVPLLILLNRFVSYRSTNADAVAALEAKIKASHEPLTLAELAAIYPPIPAQENGAEVLLDLWEKEDPAFWRAFRAGESTPDRIEMQFDDDLPFLGSDAERFDRVTALKPENIAAGNTYLESQKEHMVTVRRAMDYPKFRFPVLLTNGISALVPHLAQLQQESKNFRIEALLAAERGDVDGALSSLEDVAKIGRTLTSEPVMISQLVRIRYHAFVIDELQRLLSRQSLSTQQLARVDALLDQLKMPGALRLALTAERAIGLSAFSVPLAVIAGKGTSDGGGVSSDAERSYRIALGLLGATGLKDADQRLTLETHTAAIALADRDDAKSIKECEQLFHDASENARRLPPKFFSAILLPSMEKTTTRFSILEAHRHAAKLAVAIERYRMSHNGNLPAQIDQLAPEFIAAVPKDPFTGESFLLKPLPTGFVVYSLGVNRVDDGGKERPRTGASGKDWDETFYVER